MIFRKQIYNKSMVTATKSFVFLQEKQLCDNNFSAYWDANFATFIKKTVPAHMNRYGLLKCYFY